MAYYYTQINIAPTKDIDRRAEALAYFHNMNIADALLMCSKNKWKSIKVKVKYIAKAVVYARYRYFSDCDFIEIIPQS